MDLNWYMMISIVVNICFHCFLGSKLSNFVYVPGHIEHILFEVFKVGKLKMLKNNCIIDQIYSIVFLLKGHFLKTLKHFVNF